MVINKEINKTKLSSLSTIQLYGLAVLRIVIGWHFLYEGLVKLFEPNWTSANYLLGSKWLFCDFFHSIANNPTVLLIVDQLNIWGLILIGSALFFGFFSRIAGFFGMVLLGLYYITNPPLPGFITPGAEGHYMYVNKNLIEMIALLVLMFVPTDKFLGLTGFIKQLRTLKVSSSKAQSGSKLPKVSDDLVSVSLHRRGLLKHLATLPLLGGFTYGCLKQHSYEEKLLEDKLIQIDGISGATPKAVEFASLKDLSGKIPHAKIGPLDISRVIMGGNLIAGYAHARDLIYVSHLIKKYHTKEKIFETLYLAEQCGINTLLISAEGWEVVKQYRDETKGKIQYIADCGHIEEMKKAIDYGADACYFSGAAADPVVARGETEQIVKALELLRRNQVVAGIGAHRIETVKACVAEGFQPDFWMKTLHHLDYWSAKHEQRHDNIFCANPEETIAFMKTVKQPWIAFKTLAAGAIHPAEGFKYAFENGADFVCVGTYDFQVVENANIALNVLRVSLKITDISCKMLSSR